MSKRPLPASFECPECRRRCVDDKEALLRAHVERSIASIDRARRTAAVMGHAHALGMLDVALRSMTLVRDKVQDPPSPQENSYQRTVDKFRATSMR